MLRALEVDLKHNITKESLTKLTPAKISRELNKSIGGRTIEQRLKLNARNLYKDATKAVKQDILAAIREHQAQGHSIDKMTRTIKSKLHTDTYRARRIARTESHRMREFSTYESQIEAQKYEMFKRQWLATADTRTRHEHITLDGKFEGEDGMFHYGEWATFYPGGFGVAKMDIHCFPGETLVYQNSPIETMYKQLYTGKFVTIKSASGIKVTGTFNHPVYTLRGWIALGELKKTDKVAIVRNISRFKPKNIDKISTFKEIYDFAVGIFPRIKRASNVGMNFHGYIPEHEVDIVFTDSFLRNGVKLTKGSKDWKLMRSLFMKSGFSYFSILMSFFNRKLMAFTSGISCFCKFLSVFFAHAEVHSIGAVTRLNSSSFESSEYNIPGTSEESSGCLNGIRGIIEFDDILSLDTSVKSCHVYNLQSVNNYYFVNSVSHSDIGLLVHNCRCTVIANFDDVIGDPNFIKHGNNQEEWENDIMDKNSNYNKDKLIMDTLDPNLYPFDVAMSVSEEMEKYMDLVIEEFESKLKSVINTVYYDYIKAEYAAMNIELQVSKELDSLYLARQQKIFKKLAKAYPEGAKKIKVLSYDYEPRANYNGYMMPFKGRLNINSASINNDIEESIRTGWCTQGSLEFGATDRTLVHEYGHWVDLTDEGWLSAGRRKPGTMTGYGRTNNQEAFAESFVNAVTAPKELKDQEMVKFVERVTNKKVVEIENFNLEVLTE